MTTIANDRDASPIGQFIAGARVSATGPEVRLTSPRDGSIIATIPGATAAEVEAAYDAASAAWPSWRSMTPRRRAEIFQRAADIILGRVDRASELISLEMGKPRTDARNEVIKGVDILHYYAFAGYERQGTTYRSDTGDDVTVVQEPRGCCVLISPWNFPFTLPLRKIAAALVTGNVAIFKPAPGGVLIGLEIAEAFSEAGLPPGVLNLVFGEIGDIEEALFTDPRLAAVSFTGSWPSAQAIRSRTPVHVPLQAELGGKNALVVWRDADIEQAVQIITASAFPNNGQICTSAGRVLVHEQIAADLLAALRRAINERDPGESGVLSSRAAHDRIEKFFEELAGSAREIVRAPWPAGLMAPSIVVDPEPGPWTDEEIFGPVVTFETFADLDEAIALANQTRYGLTAGIVSSDLSVVKRFCAESTAGTVKVNGPLTGTPFHIALQGFGQSGAGDGEGGAVSLEFFTRKKTVYMRGR